MEVSILVPGSADRPTTEVEVAPKLLKARNLLNHELLLTFLELCPMAKCLTVFHGADERGDPAEVEHQNHGDVQTINSWLVDLLVKLHAA